MMTVFGDLKGCIRTEGAVVFCAPGGRPQGGERGQVSLRNFGMGEGGALSGLASGHAQGRVDSDEQTSNGDSAIEGTECQD